jgi:diphosphomevalonate decarboxylase
MKVTAIANSNIALVKYWGKRNEELNLPFNNSISFTMDDQLQTVTTVEFDEKLKKDKVILDGVEANERESARAVKFLDVIRKMAKIKLNAIVVSKNSFPKSAGLASSASGFAALAAAASKAAGLNLTPRELSMLARIGSGSACRSVFGGAVEWRAGKKRDGSDSYAFQLSPPEDWRDLRNVIAIVSEDEKKVSSMEGMKRVKNSALFSCRLKTINERLRVIRNAIKTHNFAEMANAIMQESNNLHAVMLDSWPPVSYLSDVSLEIIKKVIELNESFAEPVAAYTFDAGPNAHIYTTLKHCNEIVKILKDINGVKRIIVCGIGEGIRFSDKHLF